MASNIKKINYRYRTESPRGIPDFALVRRVLEDTNVAHIGLAEMMGEAPRAINGMQLDCKLITAPRLGDIELRMPATRVSWDLRDRWDRLLSSVNGGCFVDEGMVRREAYNTGESDIVYVLPAPIATAVYGSLINSLRVLIDRLEQDLGVAPAKRRTIDELRRLAEGVRARLVVDEYSQMVAQAITAGIYDYCTDHPRLGACSMHSMDPHCHEWTYAQVAELTDKITEASFNLGVLDRLYTPSLLEENTGLYHTHYQEGRIVSPLVWELSTYLPETTALMSMAQELARQEVISSEFETRCKTAVKRIDRFFAGVRKCEGITTTRPVDCHRISKTSGPSISYSWEEGHEVIAWQCKLTVQGLIVTVARTAVFEHNHRDAELPVSGIEAGVRLGTYQMLIPAAPTADGKQRKYDKATQRAFTNRMAALMDIQVEATDVMAIAHGGYIGWPTVRVPLRATEVPATHIIGKPPAELALVQEEANKHMGDVLRGLLAPATNNKPGRRIDLD